MNEIIENSSQADNQAGKLAEDVKRQAAELVKQIEELVQAGALTYEQGLNLMNFVTKKAFEKYTNYSQTPHDNSADLLKETPEFFNRDGRIEVFDYLRSINSGFDKDEIFKISALVEKIEKAAIERYLKEKEHEKTLNSENEAAKLKLRANAQNSVSDGSVNQVFTREQIGKMSGAEFAKHERAIMENLRKGLIK